MSDFNEILIIFFTILIGIFIMVAVIMAIYEEKENESLYKYECVTLDNETITCDNVKETESGIIGKRDDTSYLIKQYKKVKKENKDE